MRMFGFLLSIVLFFTACASNKNTAQDTQPTTEPETQILAPSETESEFTGNPILDEADAGNSEVAANDVTAADSGIEGSESEDSDGESEMSLEEADDELAADMAAGDSTSLETLPKLTLDMTTAFVPTASRRISAPYGIRTYRMHRGVDMGLCHGEDRTIVAAFTGVVTKVRNQGRRKGYGKYVILDHGNGLTTLYAHLASWKVNVGDTLQAGDTIGVGGNTGRSFGAHLHFEMKYHGNYIDPATIFNFEEGTFQSALITIEPQEILAVEEGFQKELSKHRYYKVRSGDCLGKIARKYGISVTRLKQLNGIKGNTIRPGQVLRCS